MATMMAQVREVGRRAIQVPLAWLVGALLPGFGFAGWAIALLLGLNEAWTRNEVEVARLRSDLTALASEQVAGRNRGDNRQAQINVHDTKIAVITATLDDLKEGVADSNRKLDRLMEQRFGRVQEPPN